MQLQLPVSGSRARQMPSHGPSARTAAARRAAAVLSVVTLTVIVPTGGSALLTECERASALPQKVHRPVLCSGLVAVAVPVVPGRHGCNCCMTSIAISWCGSHADTRRTCRSAAIPTSRFRTAIVRARRRCHSPSTPWVRRSKAASCPAAEASPRVRARVHSDCQLCWHSGQASCACVRTRAGQPLAARHSWH